MNYVKYKSRIYFCFLSSEDFKVISQKVSEAFNSTIIDIDYENVYEWSQQSIDNQYYINISRNHTKARSDVSNPVKIFFEADVFTPIGIDEIGYKLKALSNTLVHYGNCIHLCDDDYGFEIIKSY